MLWAARAIAPSLSSTPGPLEIAAVKLAFDAGTPIRYTH
jgi:hypothetical protein